MVYAALDKTLARELSKVGRRCDAFVAKIVPKGKFDLRMFEDNFVMLRWDEYLAEKAKEEVMVGWYHNEQKVSKPNMERIYSYEGKVVLYKRNMLGTGKPYAIYKGNTLVVNASDLRSAVQEYNQICATA